jgi:replicative DNA helicase
VLLSPAAAADVFEAIGVDDFYQPAHQTVFAAMTAMRVDGTAIDAITVSDELERRGELLRIGGGPYLHTLLTSCQTAANAGYYAEIVAKKAVLRRLVQAGTRIVQFGYQGSDGADADEVVTRSRAELDKLVSDRTPDHDTSDLHDLMAASFEELDRPKSMGVKTGFPDLDDVLGGLRPGTLTVMGARPGIGKSLLCLQIAQHAASNGIPAHVVSLEMSATDLMERFWASEATIELTTLRERRLSADDWRRMQVAAERAAEWPLRVTDSTSIGLTGIQSRVAGHGCGLLVVDYLQLVRPMDARLPRQEQVAAISRGLKVLARQLQVAVLVASQVNRGSEGRTDKRPTLADLRESGAIEADADAVVLLHDDPEDPGCIELIVAKNRHGPKRSVNLAWSPYYARARSLTRESRESS